MGYIRIKVKHFLILVLSVLLLVVLFTYFKGNAMYILGKFNEYTGNFDVANAYYYRASVESPFASVSVNAAKQRINMLLEEKNLKHFNRISLIGSSTRGGGVLVDVYSMDGINEQYREFKNSLKMDDRFAEYEIGVALLNHFAGYSDIGIEIMKNMDYIRSSKLEILIKLHFSAMYMSLGEMEKAFTLIDDSHSEYGRYEVIRKDLLKYYYFMVQDYEQFKSVEVDSALRYKMVGKLDDALIKPFVDVDYYFWGFNEIIENNRENAMGKNTLSGRVMDEDKPIAFAIVYLQENAKKNRHSSIIGLHDGIRKAVVTDEKGYFYMENVPDGLYGIGIDIDWQRVSGKTAFMNKDYNIKLSGNDKKTENIVFHDTTNSVRAEVLENGNIKFDFNVPFKSEYFVLGMGEIRKNANNEQIVDYIYWSPKIKKLPFVLDVDKERLNAMRMGVCYSSDGVDPYNFVDPLYHTGEYAYILYAYDKNGNMLYDSRGIYQNSKYDTVYIQGSEWDEADRLLLDGMYEEAIQEYEKNIQLHNDDIHSAKALAKLYYNGWKLDEEKFRLIGRNYEKARYYFEILEDKIQDNHYIKESLAHIYTDTGEYQKAINLYNETAKENAYIYHRLGRVYTYMGKLHSAEECYWKYHEGTGNGIDSLLMLYILQNKTDVLLETARMYNNRSYYAEYERVIAEYLKTDKGRHEEFFKLINNNQIDKAKSLIENDDSDLANLFKGIMILQSHIKDYEEREKLYEEFYSKVDEKNIRGLMKYFGKSGLNTGFGD